MAERRFHQLAPAPRVPDIEQDDAPPRPPSPVSGSLMWGGEARIGALPPPPPPQYLAPPLRLSVIESVANRLRNQALGRPFSAPPPSPLSPSSPPPTPPTPTPLVAPSNSPATQAPPPPPPRAAQVGTTMMMDLESSDEEGTPAGTPVGQGEMTYSFV